MVGEIGTSSETIKLASARNVDLPQPAADLLSDPQDPTMIRNATMLAPTHPFTDDDWARLNRFMDAIYQDFIEKVAEGRRMPVEKVHGVARGREHHRLWIKLVNCTGTVHARSVTRNI